ncbi:hypothetical protein L218DRAFT_1005349 [Marasmius fiardii PR-910]|nr:hypothetical protein L218DRAFT_1005349 [Marasmius fiardii PR-910]
MARSPPLVPSRRDNDTAARSQRNTRRQLPTPEQVIDAWNSFWRPFFPGLVPPAPSKTTPVTSTTSSSDSPPTLPPSTTNTPPPTLTPTSTQTPAETEQSSSVVTATPTDSDQTTATTESVTGTKESSSTDSSSVPTSSSSSSSFPGPILPASASLSTTVVESTSSSTSSTNGGAGATQTASISTGDSKQLTTVIAGSAVGGATLVSLVVFALLCLRKRRRRSGQQPTLGSEVSPFMIPSPISPSPTQTFSATYVSDKLKKDGRIRSYPNPTESHVEFDHQPMSEREQADGDGQIYSGLKRSGSTFRAQGYEDASPPSVASSHGQSVSSWYSTDEHEEHHQILDRTGIERKRNHTSLNYPASMAASEISYWDNDDDEREHLYLKARGLLSSRRESVHTAATRSDEPLPSSFIIPLTPQRYSAMSAVPVPPLPPLVVASSQPQRFPASSRSGNPLPSPPVQPRRSRASDSEDKWERKRPVSSFTAALGRRDEVGDRVDERELDDDDGRQRDVVSPPPVYSP